MVFGLKNGTVDVGSFAATTSVIWRIRWKLISLSEILSKFVGHSLFIEKYREFLSFVPEIKGGETDLPEFESLEFKNVSFSYDFASHPKYKFHDKDYEPSKTESDKYVLKNVNLKLTAGEKIAIVGYNGAGKTTSIRIMMNVFSQDGGEVLIDGQKIDYNKVKFGYLPEERGLYPKKKISEQLIYFAELNGLSYKEAVDSVNYWLERLGMSEYKNKRLDSLSKGNQQKIQLITALAHNPDIVILDEPFSGLDPVNAMLLKDVVKEVIANNKIVIFSSHQMNYIEEFCDSIAIINSGKVVISGDLHEIKRTYPRDRIVVGTQFPEKIKNDFGDVCTEREDGTLLIKLRDPDEKKTVMKKLVENYDIDEVKVFEPSLNDIFVEYAGSQV